MKKFCLDLREHVTKIINYEKKEKKKKKKRRKTIINKRFVIYAEKNLIQMMAIKNTIK